MIFAEVLIVNIHGNRGGNATLCTSSAVVIIILIGVNMIEIKNGMTSTREGETPSGQREKIQTRPSATIVRSGPLVLILPALVLI